MGAACALFYALRDILAQIRDYLVTLNSSASQNAIQELILLCTMLTFSGVLLGAKLTRSTPAQNFPLRAWGIGFALVFIGIISTILITDPRGMYLTGIY